jgi:hypothetical protein
VVRLHLRSASRDEPSGVDRGLGISSWWPACCPCETPVTGSAPVGYRGGLVQRVPLTGTARVSVASRSAAPPTRLETRTKESNTCASRWVVETLWRSESEGCLQPRDDPRKGRSPGASRRPRFVRSSQSARVGTRKMVNYAWPGRSQGKP